MQKATQNIWREICEEGRNLVPFVNVSEKAAKDSFVGWKLEGKKTLYFRASCFLSVREQAAALMSNRFSNRLAMFFGRIILKMCLISSLLHSHILLCNAPPHKEESYVTTQKKWLHKRPPKLEIGSSSNF